MVGGVFVAGVVCCRDLAPSGRQATTAHNTLQRVIPARLRRSGITRCTTPAPSPPPPPVTHQGCAVKSHSRLFRLRSCNRSCSWGYRPTPRWSTRQITRRGYFACAPATARARGATAPHPARVRKYSHLQRRPPTTHPSNAARGLAVAPVARRYAPALYPTRPCFSPLAECPPRV